MNVIISHPTGNQNVRAIISALFKAGMLYKFNTTLSVNSQSKSIKLLPSAIRNEMLRRTFSLPSHKINTYPWLEISRFVLPKIGLKCGVKHETGWASIDAVYKNLDRLTAKSLDQLVNEHKINAVYAYEDGALETFKKAKQLGLTCVYDLPIAFWEMSRRLLTEEAVRLPEWAQTLGGGILDSTAKLDRKSEELELADVVVGPGQFVIDSLPVFTNYKKIIISPFGSPSTVFFANPGIELNKTNLTNRPLRVLFVGSMGQRKGLGDLFAAMRLLNNPAIELIVMGALLAPMDFYKREFEHFIYEPGRSNSKVLALMRSCDVFCLPSIVEGRALVMQEAMSQGLPLIITANTGGEDLILEGKTGFLVPIRSPQEIANKINWFFENRSEIPIMGKLSQAHAAKYTWDKYGEKITSELNKTACKI